MPENTSQGKSWRSTEALPRPLPSLYRAICEASLHLWVENNSIDGRSFDDGSLCERRNGASYCCRSPRSRCATCGTNEASTSDKAMWGDYEPLFAFSRAGGKCVRATAPYPLAFF